MVYLVCIRFATICKRSRCPSPTKKLDCLVKLKDVLIQCIDEHRDSFNIIESNSTEIEESDRNEFSALSLSEKTRR